MNSSRKSHKRMQKKKKKKRKTPDADVLGFSAQSKCNLILFYLWLKISLYYCLFGYWLILLGFGDLGLGLGVGLGGGILWWCLV